MKPIRLTVLAAVALVAPLAFAQDAKLMVGLMLPATGEAVAKRGHEKIVTDGTLEAQGADAEGIFTTLHYADGLNTLRDNAFRLDFHLRQVVGKENKSVGIASKALADPGRGCKQ